MFCQNCGRELEEGWTRCPNCGAKVVDEMEQDNLVYQNGTEASSVPDNVPVINRNAFQESGKVTHRSFWKYVFFSLITGGIYGIVVLYGYVKDINKVCEGDGKESKNYIIVLLLTVVTCGIYGIYWWYVQGERLYNAAPRYSVPVKEKGSTILLWEILGCTIMPGIGALVATYIMFDNMNRIALIYNGEISENEMSKLNNPHPHLVRNVIIIYVIVLALGIGLITTGISSLFLYDMDNEYDYLESGDYLDDDSDFSDYSDDSSDYENNFNQADKSDNSTNTMKSQKAFITLHMINNMGVDIYFLYMGEADNDSWGVDLLEATSDITGAFVLQAEDSVSMPLALDKNALVFDIKIEDVNGNIQIFRDIDVSNYNEDGVIIMFNADGTFNLG